MASCSGACEEVPEADVAEGGDYEVSMINNDLDLFPRSNPSTITGGKAGISSTNSVHELLECPVCTNSMYPPIYQVQFSTLASFLWCKLVDIHETRIPRQRIDFDITVEFDLIPLFFHKENVAQCPNGHTLCANCKLRVHNYCPSCRHELGNIRCLVLEKVAESLELPCRYNDLGCSEIFPYYSKLKHEQLCRFRPYNCPYAGFECPVTGDIPTLVAHLKNEHKVDMHEGCTFNHRYVKSNPHDVENATWMLTVFNCFGQYFCLHFEAFLLGTAPVYMAFLRFMGEDSDAKNFSYTLEVGGGRRKLTWQGVPRSIRDGHRKVRDSHDGLIVPRNIALFFSGGSRRELKLRVTGRICKEPLD